MVNELFAAEFGDAFQPLAFVGRVPRPRLRAAGRAARHRQVVVLGHRRPLAARRGAAHREARRRARRRRRRRAGRDRAPLRRGHRRGVVRGGAAQGRAADVSLDRSRLLRPAAGRRPARVPAAAAQPLRRRGAAHRARVAVRRRLERRARADPPRGEQAADLHRHREVAAAGSSRIATPGCCVRSASASTGSATPRTKLSLELLCERIVSEHDYDLAVLAQWDGRRRYANLRKLARLARSYEELRGADIEGFVRFVSEQEAVGARELEAVAEEEGGDAVRLLTIHAAKGLEFKVVVVADAGRDRAAAGAGRDPRALGRPLRLQGRAPVDGRAQGASGYDEVRGAEQAREEAERLRLYYVAMTRAIDRLIVSGAIDPERPSERTTPIGWVLERLERAESWPRPGATRSSSSAAARGSSCVSTGTGPSRQSRAPSEPIAEDAPARRSSPTRRACAAARAPLPELAPIPLPPLEPVRRLSFTALASFERCSYRYYAERLVGMRALRPRGREGEPGSARSTSATPCTACSRHRPARSRAPSTRARARMAPARHRGGAGPDLRLRRVLLRLPLARPWRRSRTCAPRAVRLRARRRAHPWLPRRAPPRRRERARRRLQDEPARRATPTRSSRATTGCSGSSTRSPASAAARRGRGRLPVPRAAGRDRAAAVHRADVPVLEAELSAAIARIQAGDFVPTPSEQACSGCPALDVVCAGPRLRGGAAAPGGRRARLTCDQLVTYDLFLDD